MNLNDVEFMAMMKKYFYVLTCVLDEDIAISLTDKEKHIKIRQPKSFKLNIDVNHKLTKVGPSLKAIASREKKSIRYPKEIYGFPIINHVIPLINSHTGNITGTINLAISLEKENNVIEMSENLQTFSEELSCSAQDLASSSEELAASSQDFNSNINSIHQKIKGMDDILEYINNISKTTNLLGLNAAIESARAGEHGRGFAVVAEEIRKLAQDSKDSTEKIAITLTGISDDINKMIDSICNFIEISQEQAAQTEQMSTRSGRLNELSVELLKLAENLQ